MTAMTIAKSVGEALWFGNSFIVIKLASAQGADALCVIEHWLPYGDSPPLHVHRNEDEVFHVLEGRMRFRLGDQEVVAGAGETLIAPQGVPHSFRVEDPAGAHCLTITRGADFETMVREASRPALRAELPETAQPSPEMIAELVACCARNGIDIVGAPLT